MCIIWRMCVCLCVWVWVNLYGVVMKVIDVSHIHLTEFRLYWIIHNFLEFLVEKNSRVFLNMSFCRFQLSDWPYLKELMSTYLTQNVTKWSLRSSVDFRANDIVCLVEKMPNLRELDLSDFTNLSFEDLNRIRKCSPNGDLIIIANWNHLPGITIDEQDLFRYQDLLQVTSPDRPLCLLLLNDCDAIVAHHCGYSWTDLVAGLTPLDGLADLVIESIQSSQIHTAIQQCCLPSTAAPQLKWVKFGSCVNGFGNKCSDIDLVVLSDNDAWFEETYSTCKSQRRLSQDFLYYLKETFACDTELINRARVPVLRLTNYFVGLKKVSVDITFMNSVCVLNSQLLLTYAKTDRVVFLLGQIVKSWARTNKLISSVENGHVYPSSYTWMIIVIFFLQVRVECVASHISETVQECKPLWGVSNGEYCKRGVAAPSQANTLKGKPGLLFFQFLYFLIDEAEFIRMDISDPTETVRRVKYLTVLDPFETRNLTANVYSFEPIRKCAQIFLQTEIHAEDQFWELVGMKQVSKYSCFLDSLLIDI